MEKDLDVSDGGRFQKIDGKLENGNVILVFRHSADGGNGEAFSVFCQSLCNGCNACIRNCPAGALGEDGLDARRCLSYLTIEYRGELPAATGEKLGECFYGCDRCQSVCPHNRAAQPHNEPQFAPSEELLAMQRSDWQGLTKEKFDTLFNDSAVQRCGYEQLLRNIKSTIK